MHLSRARTTPRSRSLLAAVLTTVALVATACSGADDPAADQTDGTGAAASGEPQAIISLSPTTTEMLYAVGAGDRVVAVDERSNYPADAPVTDLSGYTPNLEAILGYQPDLVVATDDTGDIVSGLERSGVEVLLLPAARTLDDTYTQIEQVGAATGTVGEAAELVSRMRGEIDEIVASVPRRETPLTYFHELDDTYYTVTDDTYIGEVYSLLGLTSIATGGDAYPQLSEELILEADPDLVMLADGQCCGITPEVVAERPGWGELAAVRQDRVFVVDEDLASRWGPRVVDFMREVAGIISTLTVNESQPEREPAS
ncbi:MULTISPECIES: ABC transporter substrate-binding protein [unclassified Dietzia]|uniref:ABC transporter substrate-binding protein n=1 Tax=unclassified Dietzia TaxID=2617939 RepID=UPI0015FD8EBC|nr:MULTISPECIES: ABC transporter substrate-binding protein [unclassified Dietzia]MBB1041252.1 ABC transporter substrate-binding protein [Dietzia sp. Cai40]MBB1045342.1 ABC transporter substrate-binding protein [Dietzia sp. DQ11-44]